MEEFKDPTPEELFPLGPISGFACADIHHRFHNLPVYFRVEICKAMNCTPGDYYRIVRSETRLASAADKFIETGNKILKIFTDYLEKEWNPDSVTGRVNPFVDIQHKQLLDFLNMYSAKELEETLWDFGSTIIASIEANAWSGLDRGNLLFFVKQITRLFRAAHALISSKLLPGDDQYQIYHEYVEDFVSSYNKEHIDEILQKYLPIVLKSDSEANLLPVLKQIILVTQVVLR